jgi:hypothetical protein
VDFRYPIGQFQYGTPLTDGGRIDCIRQIEAAPARLKAAGEDLSDTQLDTPYRPEGWTVRQVVHHLPDSHMNCYVRIRLALTEDDPTVRTTRRPGPTCQTHGRAQSMFRSSSWMHFIAAGRGSSMVFPIATACVFTGIRKSESSPSTRASPTTPGTGGIIPLKSLHFVNG